MGIRYRKPYWVPRTCGELRAGLRRMGVTRISGKPLGRVRKRQLLAVYLKVRDERWESGQLSAVSGQEERGGGCDGLEGSQGCGG